MLLVVLLALVVGGVIGVVAARSDRTEPEARVSFSDPRQLPASDPSIPVETFAPDPSDPQLQLNIPLTPPVVLAVPGPDGKPTGRRIVVPLPKGWTGRQIALQGPSAPARWQYTVEGNDPNSYVLRIDIYRGLPLTVGRAISARISALDSSTLQGNLQDFEVEEQDAEGFVATYVDRGFLRVAEEKFFAGPDGVTAYATVAISGREQDRPGMADLLARISEGIRVGD
ncbi:hypothetical protein GCM10023340_02090 [Nocardioides marinquilinus]|uniref:Uncharacterized protein n=1 Tax=Nocardioides marinquilinus TaxID=1210400 RepID=A0ABP9P8Q0_9ACTN